jgi:hypothetical protein
MGYLILKLILMTDSLFCWCCYVGTVCTECECVSGGVTCYVTLPRAYGVLGSLVFCASINNFCCCSTCIEKYSQQFIILLLLHACNNCILWSGLLYSCRLLMMCNAYDEKGLFGLIYRIYSRYLIATELPVWPTYDMLHILHCNIYRVSQEEFSRLREGVPYVKKYRYNPKQLCPKFNGYGDNGQRKVWSSGGSTHCTCQLTVLSMSVRECGVILRKFSSR